MAGNGLAAEALTRCRMVCADRKILVVVLIPLGESRNLELREGAIPVHAVILFLRSTRIVKLEVRKVRSGVAGGAVAGVLRTVVRVHGGCQEDLQSGKFVGAEGKRLLVIFECAVRSVHPYRIGQGLQNMEQT